MHYYGQIEIKEIINRPPSGNDLAGFKGMDESNIKFVHCPDCQQLIVWLPCPGRDYDSYIITGGKENILEKANVADKLNGSIQLLWDTLPFPPSAYILKFRHKSGGIHTVHFVKHRKNWKPAPPKPVIEEVKDNAPIVYRDGFGNIIVEEDLQMRAEAVEKIQNTFSRKIRYEDQGRSGYVIYSDNKRQARFLYELGGGNCMVYINIPVEENWEKETGIPAEERKEVLEYIAVTVQAEQASNCYYEIRPDSINYYYK